jgi:hypothetical protein
VRGDRRTSTLAGFFDSGKQGGFLNAAPEWAMVRIRSHYPRLPLREKQFVVDQSAVYDPTTISQWLMTIRM